MLTSAQLQALTTELQKPVYAPYISAGNLDGVLQILNAPSVSGDHYIASTDLWNALESSGAMALILEGQTNSNQSIALACQEAIEALRYSKIPEYRLENSAIQNLLNGFVSAGLMTQAQVTQFESAFTQVFTSVAEGILGRQASLQDLWIVFGRIPNS